MPPRDTRYATGTGARSSGSVPAPWWTTASTVLQTHRRVLEFRQQGRRHELWAETSALLAFLVAAAAFAPDTVVLPRACRPRSPRVPALFTTIGRISFTRENLRRRLYSPLTGATAVALIVAAVTAGVAGAGNAAPVSHHVVDGKGTSGSIMARMAHLYGAQSAPALAAATSAPAPAPPSLADAPVLGSHEVFGFAPYWTLPEAPGFNMADLTTLAYFSVNVNGDGSINESGPGWDGYESQDLANLVTRAHAAGDRVVLTASCFDQATLNAVTSDPSAPATLAASLTSLVSAKNLDGVNFDFEGQGSADQLGLDNLIAQVSGALRAADPHWQITMDTYASSAGDSQGFYDIAGLAPSVDAFFVMAYDMDAPSTPSPTAPLSGTGFTDEEAVAQYTHVVPASKIILGIPYYGYSWPTTGPDLGDPATGSPTPVPYSQQAASGQPVYWDPTSQTAWTSFQVGTQWYQTWFDNPTSVTLKAELANSAHLAGVGAWALGMDGNSPAMLAALVGKGRSREGPSDGTEGNGGNREHDRDNRYRRRQRPRR